MLRLGLVTRGLGACLLLWACAATSAAEVAEQGVTWKALTPAQQQALAPLQRDWRSIEGVRKQKWLEVAARFATMPPEERVRIQTRMAEWARLTPAERATARLQFQQARDISAAERRERWQAYSELPDAERRQLAQRAKTDSKPSAASATGSSSAKPPLVTSPASAVASASAPARTEMARNKPTPTAARNTGPTVVQAKPGATTTSMSTRPAPPAHHQPGLPKIAATPGFVDPATLLPKRGPQGAAVANSAAASDDNPSP